MSRSVLLCLADALAYLVCTFALALLWHLLLFQEVYVGLGWPSADEADVPLGFLAVLTQSVVLALAFQKIEQPGPIGRRAFVFAGGAFVFLWSSHVIGDAAKCGFTPKITFIAIETTYLAAQFLIFGAALTIIHRVLDPATR